MSAKNKFSIDPICPYCGHEQSDAWELCLETDGAKREVDCLKCELPFTVELSLTVRYNTYPLRDKVLLICAEENIAVPGNLLDAAEKASQQ